MDRIPLEVAHQILATFGINSPTAAYERWVKKDGFDLQDFESVLYESPFVITLDWRAWLQEELETIADALSRLDLTLDRELNEDGEEGDVVCGERRARVVYRATDGSDFDDVIRAAQRVVGDRVQFRAAPTNDGSDTWRAAGRRMGRTGRWLRTGAVATVCGAARQVSCHGR